MTISEWDIYVVNEVRAWINELDDTSYARVVSALDALAEGGSSIANMKELRPGSMRILFVFDPWRSSVLLVAGGKSGQWQAWYEAAIPLAEQRYEIYLKERAAEEGSA